MQLDTDIHNKYVKYYSPEFDEPSYSPESIRTKKISSKGDRPFYDSLDFFQHGVSDINVLDHDKNNLLFKEIHWSCHKIRKHPNKDNTQLFKRIAEAEEELLLGNRLLVLKEIKTFKKFRMWTDDCRQDAFIVLLNAIRNFDLEQNVTFYSYASVAIKRKFLNKSRDLTRKGDIFYYSSPEEDLVREFLEKHPESDFLRIAKECQISKEKSEKLLKKIADSKNNAPPRLSLDKLCGEVGNESIVDHIQDEKYDILNIIEKDLTIAECQSILKKLGSDMISQRKIKVFNQRFIEGKKLHEIGENIGVTRSRVLQIENQVIKLLREKLSLV